MQIETRILGGLPVIVTFSTQPAEPDVGIFQSYAEDVTIFVERKGKLRHAPWAEARLTPNDWAALADECNQHAAEDDEWSYDEGRYEH